MIRSLVVLCISLLALLVSGCSKTPVGDSPDTGTASNTQGVQEVDSTVCYKETCRAVEIADESSEQKQGLMKVTELDDDAGMLFVFPKIAARPFWMKDTLIPLDMIWMDDTGEIVHIHRDVQPCPPSQGDDCPVYGPKTPSARYVLELNAGQADAYGLALGESLTLP